MNNNVSSRMEVVPAPAPGSINNGISSSPQPNTSRYKVIKPYEIKFLDVVKLLDMICPVTNLFTYDPYQLIPCGHTFDLQGIVSTLRDNGDKSCPLCKKTYTFGIENLFLKNTHRSFFYKSSQLNKQLTQTLEVLYRALPNTEQKAKIGEFINLFLSGKINSATYQLAETILKTPDAQLLIPILRLMKAHPNPVNTSRNPRIKALTPPPSINSSIQSPLRPSSNHTPSLTASSSKPGIVQVQALQPPANGQVLVRPMQPPANGLIQGTPTPSARLNTPYLPPVTYIGNGAVQGQPNNPPINSELDKLIDDLKFLEIVKLADLICPLTKQFMTNAYQLIPCGHNFNKNGIIDLYAKNQTRICPTCTKPYTSVIINISLNKIVRSFQWRLFQPDQQLKRKIVDFYKTLPESEKNTELSNAIRNFMSGDIWKYNKVAELALSSQNHRLYLPILSLMEEHRTKVDADIQELLRHTLEPVSENSYLQNTPNLPASSSSHFQDMPAQDEDNRAHVSLPLLAEILPDSNTPSSSSTSSTNGGNRQTPNLTLKLKRPLSNPDLPSSKRARTRSSDENESENENENDAEAENSAQVDPNIQAIVIDEAVTTTSTTTSTDSSSDSLEDERVDSFPSASSVDSMANNTSDKSLIILLKSDRKFNLFTHVKPSTVNARDEEGNTPLHLIVRRYKFTKIIWNKMAKYDVNFDAQNLNGETALHIAAKMNKLNFIHILLELGASKDIVDNNDKRPLDLASKSEIIKALR